MDYVNRYCTYCLWDGLSRSLNNWRLQVYEIHNSSELWRGDPVDLADGRVAETAFICDRWHARRNVP